jgi:hypothetical protein
MQRRSYGQAILPLLAVIGIPLERVTHGTRAIMRGVLLLALLG